MLERYLLLWLTLLSGIAYSWPLVFPETPPASAAHSAEPAASSSSADHPAPSDSANRPPSIPNPFLTTKPYLAWMIAVLMFSVGALLPPEEVRQVAARWPVLLGGTALQYTSMPLLAYVCGTLFPLTQAEFIGVIVVGCVPGAMASNVLTLVARGNVSYSIGLTTCSTLLSPIVVPLALKLTLHKNVHLQPGEVALMLALTVAGPVLLGYAVCRLHAGIDRFFQKFGAAIAQLLVLWVIAVVVALTRNHLSQGLTIVLAALLAINLLGYGAGYLGGIALRLPEPMRRALTIEIGMQNAGVGTAVVLQFFPDQPAAAIPTAVYTFGCMLTGTLLAQAWAWFDDRKATQIATP